jgi:hypothetical protein
MPAILLRCCRNIAITPTTPLRMPIFRVAAGLSLDGSGKQLKIKRSEFGFKP